MVCKDCPDIDICNGSCLKKDKQYVLELNEEQLEALMYALDTRKVECRSYLKDGGSDEYQEYFKSHLKRIGEITHLVAKII